jgi:hypothetical protein
MNALRHHLLELTGEISSTDNRDFRFRQELKHEKEVLSVLMNRMKLE